MSRGDEVQFRSWAGYRFEAIYVAEGRDGGHRLIVTSPDWVGERDINVPTEMLVRGIA